MCGSMRSLTNQRLSVSDSGSRPQLKASGRRHGCLDVPSKFVDALVNNTPIERVFTCPISQRFRFAAPRDQDRIAVIVGLLNRCRPTNIARLVIPVVVDAIDRVFTARPRSHISQEVHEVVAPRRGHLDAAAAIVLPRRIVWITAALFCVMPSSIYGSAAHAVRLTTRPGLFSTETPAANDAAFTKHRPRSGHFPPAITSTQPNIFFVSVRDSDQATKPLTGDVDKRAAHFLNDNTHLSLCDESLIYAHPVYARPTAKARRGHTPD